MYKKADLKFADCFFKTYAFFISGLKVEALLRLPCRYFWAFWVGEARLN